MIRAWRSWQTAIPTLNTTSPYLETPPPLPLTASVFEPLRFVRNPKMANVQVDWRPAIPTVDTANHTSNDPFMGWSGEHASQFLKDEDFRVVKDPGDEDSLGRAISDEDSRTRLNGCEHDRKTARRSAFRQARLADKSQQSPPSGLGDAAKADVGSIAWNDLSAAVLEGRVSSIRGSGDVLQVETKRYRKPPKPRTILTLPSDPKIAELVEKADAGGTPFSNDSFKESDVWMPEPGCTGSRRRFRRRCKKLFEAGPGTVDDEVLGQSSGSSTSDGERLRRTSWGGDLVNHPKTSSLS